MPLTSDERQWYYDQIAKLDPKQEIVSLDLLTNRLTYSSHIQTDEPMVRDATGEELVRALTLCILRGSEYGYPIDSFYIEKYYEHGSSAASGHGRDEVDLIIYDDDGLPFAMWEFKSAEEYDQEENKAIRYQLFGTSPLVGAPKLLVYATIRPQGTTPRLLLKCIDRTDYQAYDSWVNDNRPHATYFPELFTDPTFQPLVMAGTNDLRLDATQSEFRAAAATFHNEFFGEHPDTVLFTNLMKCLLAKIYDERQTKRGESYKF